MKHLYLILLSTFIIGFFSGVFIFLESGKPAVVSKNPTNKFQGVEIIADTYGGCELLGCSSYRIVEDGTYTFIQNSGDEENRYSDQLSHSRITELLYGVEETDLGEVEESEFDGTCTTFVDGTAYRFEIFTDKGGFVFDSCQNDLEGMQLFEDLIDYFQIFNITHIK